eukprot:TRINITY_DN4070_c0_g1_i8.p3 TRINITY_DN4070_c0_g1~~TRINITY_DN4070_c0_g1_i8.p3  ORF type:complete len:220 (-),score=24.81 TRINITY_DN4070_c0_g1_i8:29-688(-)
MVSGALGVASLSSMGLPRAAAVAAMLAPDGADVRAAMLRVGLHAESLAASGVVARDVATIVSDATSYLSANHASMLLADADAASARSRVGHYLRLVQSGVRDEATVAALDKARSDMAASEASLDKVLKGLFQAATKSLDVGERSRLATLRAQQGWTIPTQYLCSARSEAELVALRRAVSAKRIAEDEGRPVDGAVQAQLNARDAVKEKGEKVLKQELEK